jgi:hypothetical protein
MAGSLRVSEDFAARRRHRIAGILIKLAIVYAC